jgi:predicted TIM-barrel fold metal-dependent hydrolase
VVGVSDPEAILRAAIAPFAAEIAERRPAGAEVVEAHAHLGRDEDGRSLDPATLAQWLDQADAGRAVVFPLHDPERSPAYRVPNDRVLAWAEESEGRFLPFCRLDPSDEPLAEGARCLERGARGIKLHPRAQSFGFADGVADGIFALAEQAQVPVLIHAGRGMPPIADGLVDLALRHPSVVLILAHAGIADQGVFAARLADHPGVLYDTSCFSALDVLALFARVAPQRIVFASDPPYGRPFGALYLVLRAAAATGLDAATTSLVVGGTIARLLAGESLPPTTPPAGNDDLELSSRLGRIVAYASIAFGMLMAAGPEKALDALDLIAAASRDPEPGPVGAALERIHSAAQDASRLARLGPEWAWPAFGLVHMSMSLAATEREAERR